MKVFPTDLSIPVAIRRYKDKINDRVCVCVCNVFETEDGGAEEDGVCFTTQRMSL